MPTPARSARVRAIIRRGQLHIRDAEGIHRPSPEDAVRMLDGDDIDHVEILGEEAVDAAVRALETDRIGRRTVVTNGALAATTGIFTLWLPGSAMAASLDVAAEGTDFASTSSLTATNSNAATMGFIPIDGYSGSLLQIVVEATSGGLASTLTYDAGRGRRIADNYDLAVLQGVTSDLEVRSGSNFNGGTTSEGGGDGGQAVAVMASSSSIVVMAGGGGGAGTDAVGGDADGTGGSYTNPAGGIITGGSPGSDGSGGIGGSASGSWVSGPADGPRQSGLDYPGGGPAGVMTSNLAGGLGGGGYGGGGEGGRGVEFVDSTNVARGAGGGGGGSFVNPAYRVGFVASGFSTRSIPQRCRVTWYFN